MSESNAAWIITSKLYVPRARASLVSRPRLTQQIAASSAKLILVSGPPGSGKTTLLSEWGAHQRGPVAWLTLDEGDNDPIRFWSSVIASLQTVYPNVGLHAAAVLRTQQAVDMPTESVLASLLNDLGVLPGEPTLTLVIDDYHLVQNPAIDDALSFFIDHLPPPLRLLLSSRTDPNLPLARLRAGNALTEVRQADLRFTAAETSEFLNRAMGLHLSERQIALLEARTEGWIAGLQLVALSLVNCGDATAFITAFTGSNRYIFDYLVEQVLVEQPEEIRSFLLDTCVLDRLTGPLCDALTGGSNGASLLEELERANLFVVPLDDERRWYRYHHLFAEFLRHHVRQRQAHDLPALYRRAAAWCGDHNLASEAIGYALAGEHFELAAQLIAQSVVDVMMRGEFVTIHRWVRALPDTLIRSNLRLSIAYGWVLIVAGQLDAAEERLQDAERLLPADDPSAEAQFMRGNIVTMRALLTSHRGDLNRTITLARAALEQLPPDNTTLRSMLNLGVGNILREWNDLDGALQQINEAITLARQNRDAYISMKGYLARARVQACYGDFEKASEAVEETREIVAQWPSSEFQQEVAAIRVGLALRGGQWEIIEPWLETRGAQLRSELERDLAPSPSRQQEYVVLARVLIAQGRQQSSESPLREALQLLQRLTSAAEAAGRSGRVIELTMLTAQARAALGDRPAAQAALEQALVLAEPQGYIRLFVDEGEPLRSMIADLRLEIEERVEARSLTSYLGALLAVFARASSRTSIQSKTNLRSPIPPPPPDPTSSLTGRELEILQLIAKGMSNQEIADRLVLTLGTVKWYVNQILSKLRVHSRTEALARAREIGLPL